MATLTKYPDVFIEVDQYREDNEYYMKIFHNCGNTEENLVIKFMSLEGELCENESLDFIALNPSSIYLFSLVSTYEFSQFEEWQPITYTMMLSVSQKIDLFKKGLIDEKIDSEMFTRLCDEPDDELVDYLTNFKSSSPKTTKYWQALFKNKEKIIAFYDALQWYILEYRNFKQISNNLLLNVQGMYTS